MLRGYLALSFVGLLVAGCHHEGRAGHARHGGESEAADHAGGDAHSVPTDPATVAAAARVRVLSSERLDCATEALGIVDVHENVDNQDAALDILRRRAAARGAEAVTGVEFRHGEGGREKTHLSGMAVRCRDLLRGRQYDVVQRLEITDGMGREDEAFDKLKSRARALGANLIVDVRFGHGESGSEGVRVSGTAVRAYDPPPSGQ
jgi:uncharacterized protein YbjQ (UPF0145 family)